MEKIGRQLLAGCDAALAAYPAALADYNEKYAAWKKDSRPGNDAAMKQWQAEANAAAAAGLVEPPRPKLVPEPVKPDPAGASGQPTALFNGMIAPLVPFAIKGAIWYQGENNAKDGAAYQAAFSALIRDWRSKWSQGDFPFLFVQLPNYEGSWALLRESQSRTLPLPNTGMAVAIDVGIPQNLHPPFKEVVGERLALVAERVAYGKDLVDSGPAYRSMQVQGDAARLTFDHVGGGLTIGTSPVSGHGFVPAPTDRLVAFTVAGEDKQWFPAAATIEGGTVIVSSPHMPHPVAVRYGWDPPGICNLYNKEGLPAPPFRTDSW
jgi:sialate O-acetylesterase